MKARLIETWSITRELISDRIDRTNDRRRHRWLGSACVSFFPSSLVCSVFWILLDGVRERLVLPSCD